MGMYGRIIQTNVVDVYLSNIRIRLMTTEYTLASAYVYPKISGRFGRRRTKRYYIEPSVGKQAEEKPTEGIADVTI
jgi:hypothetical protein